MTDSTSHLIPKITPSDQRFNGQTGHLSGPVVALDGVSMRERCTALGIEWLEEAPATTPEAVAAITAEVAVRLRVVPLRFENNRLLVAMVDPLDMASADEVATLTGRPITRAGL